VDYITKPLQFDEVLARVVTHLQLNDLRKSLKQKAKQRTAELEASNKELEELCYSMSHNLRARCGTFTDRWSCCSQAAASRDILMG